MAKISRRDSSRCPSKDITVDCHISSYCCRKVRNSARTVLLRVSKNVVVFWSCFFSTFEKASRRILDCSSMYFNDSVELVSSNCRRRETALKKLSWMVGNDEDADVVVLDLDLGVAVEFGSRLSEDMDSRISDDVLDEDDAGGTWPVCSNVLVSFECAVEGTIAVTGVPVPGGLGVVVNTLVGSVVELLLVAMLVSCGSDLAVGESDIAQESRAEGTLRNRKISVIWGLVHGLIMLGSDLYSSDPCADG